MSSDDPSQPAGDVPAPAVPTALSATHPDVTPDFVFGDLAASPETLRKLAAALGGVQHQYHLTPLRPTAGAPVLVQATTGPAFPAVAAWLYYTTDGSRPAGEAGQATVGTAVAMAWCETRWADLLWDYLSVWEGTIPAQPSGTLVRYAIEALAQPGSGLPAGWADASDEGPGGYAPVFAYLVDAPTAPAWVRDAIIYHIYLDRFDPGPSRTWRSVEREWDVLGGTLAGVTARLDYIAALGVNTLWLSPIFQSPTYHRYDAGDLFQVDAALGTNADLRTLVQAAHARGMRVLLDLAANHLSSQHPFFQAAQADRSSPYYDWFTWQQWPDNYTMFFTSKALPRLNNEHPAARAHVLDAVLFWMSDYEVDGYRLDYVLGPSHDFWTTYYRAVKRIKPDSFSVAEATHGAEVLRSYEGRMDGALDFTFLTMIRGLIAFGSTTISAFDRYLEQSARFFTSGFVLPTFLDNHDMNRFLWVAKGDTRKLKLAAAIQFTLAAPPIIYYGTEVGIRQQGDVRGGGWGRDVEARGPMLWGADQDADLLAFYQRLGAIRHAHPAIRHGQRLLLHLDNAAGTYAYAQIAPAMLGLVALFNLNAQPYTLTVALPTGVAAPTTPRDLLNGFPVTRNTAGLTVELPPFGAALVELA